MKKEAAAEGETTRIAGMWRERNGRGMGEGGEREGRGRGEGWEK